MWQRFNGKISRAESHATKIMWFEHRRDYLFTGLLLPSDWALSYCLFTRWAGSDNKSPVGKKSRDKESTDKKSHAQKYPWQGFVARKPREQTVPWQESSVRKNKKHNDKNSMTKCREGQVQWRKGPMTEAYALAHNTGFTMMVLIRNVFRIRISSTISY